MSLKQTILNDLKDAMKARNAEKSTVLRSIKAAVQEKEISLRSGGERSDLSDEAVTQVLMKAAKQRKDSIEQFEKASRSDLADVERFELKVIESYLPKMMSESEIESVVRETAAETGASNPGDLGRLMGALMPKVKGKADGSLVNKVARQVLSE